MITFKTEPDNAVRAIHVPTGINAFYGSTFSYKTNKAEAFKMLTDMLASKKTPVDINKLNFQLKIDEFVASSCSLCVSEYNQSEQELAQDYLEAFFKTYFEIDSDKEARRAQYLELAKEFGEHLEQPFIGYCK